MIKITITLFKDKNLTDKGFGALIESDLGDTGVAIYRSHSIVDFLWRMWEVVKGIVKNHAEMELFKELEDSDDESK